jgi:hypothetical protein
MMVPLTFVIHLSFEQVVAGAGCTLIRPLWQQPRKASRAM